MEKCPAWIPSDEKKQYIVFKVVRKAVRRGKLVVGIELGCSWTKKLNRRDQEHFASDVAKAIVRCLTTESRIAADEVVAWWVTAEAMADSKLRREIRKNFLGDGPRVPRP